MKKLFLLVPLTMLILIMNIQAQENLPTNTPTTRENILEDAVIDLLQPQMYSAVEKQYGTTNEIGFMCLRVVEIKKQDPGFWLFEVKLEGLTYTGVHYLLDTFTVTVKKDESTLGKWSLQDYKVRNFDLNEKSECRIPA